MDVGLDNREFWEHLEEVMGRVVAMQLEPVKAELKEVRLTLENRIEPSVRLLADGHLQNAKKLDNMDDKLRRVDLIENNVKLLMTEAKLRNKPAPEPNLSL